MKYGDGVPRGAWYVVDGAEGGTVSLLARVDRVHRHLDLPSLLPDEEVYQPQEQYRPFLLIAEVLASFGGTSKGLRG